MSKQSSQITELDHYNLHNPIDITIERLSTGSYIAIFDEAEISFSGDTSEDAIANLKIEIEEVYQLYRSEPQLGILPSRQFTVLQKYLY